MSILHAGVIVAVAGVVILAFVWCVPEPSSDYARRVVKYEQLWLLEVKAPGDRFWRLPDKRVSAYDRDGALALWLEYRNHDAVRALLLENDGEVVQ